MAIQALVVIRYGPRSEPAAYEFLRNLRMRSMFPRRKIAALEITKVLSGVLSGKVYPATPMPPSIPTSIMNTFNGLVIFNGLLGEQFPS